MTLCPQWQAEIKRFAPWMKCLTLHNEEIDSLPAIASADVIVISTFMVATQRGRPFELMKKLRKIHFHRIFLDESHLNHNNGRHADNSRDTNSTRLYKVLVYTKLAWRSYLQLIVTVSLEPLLVNHWTICTAS